MKSNEVRSLFIEFFKSKGHEHVKSSPLIPRHDPTLLFTNAGMVQFKSLFLGEEKSNYKRAVTSQKCMRAGGKHSDIENVGHTNRHHTFFEMLGNFSFGDYFKDDAIAFAWELLTKHFGLPEDKLWATVYTDDDESERLWQEVVGMPKERIIRLGAKDNFWQMGDTGPCGPCSEIIIDQGEGTGCSTPECKVGCDCDRFLELWNLVFMQYNRDDKGTLTPLPKPSIDTGMGLERLCSVLQGKESNFDTDLFEPLMRSIGLYTGHSYGKDKSLTPSFRVIADHVRASAFLLSDGVMPANDGRGYVLRRIIRRASRHARILGVHEPVLYKVMDSIVQSMGGVYRELKDEAERSVKILKLEEERFSRTLEQGMKILDDMLSALAKSGGDTIPGDEVFRLYDTFGFPVDLVRDIALDSVLKLDEQGFHNAMEAQRERARASWVGEETAVASIYREIVSEAGKTAFDGYDSFQTDSVVRAIIKDGKVVEELQSGDEAEAILDRTPFYGESGGQVGDIGSMHSEDCRVEVVDTQKPIEGCYVHRIKVISGRLRVWDRVSCQVNEQNRRSIMRNHTATHLLQSALRHVLGDHVKQAGSLVTPERLRFDFTHFSSVPADEINAAEDIVNDKIMGNLSVGINESDVDEAVRGGATALFGEKYAERVRVVSVDGFSKELCGGTHIRSTGEIGLFAIISEGSVASGIRRIEAVTGTVANELRKAEHAELAGIKNLLKIHDSPTLKITAMLDELKEIKRAQQQQRSAQATGLAGNIVQSAKDIHGIKVISYKAEGIDQKDLRELADRVRDRVKSGVIMLASVIEGQAFMVSMVTSDLTDRFKAGDIMKSVAKAAGGTGGGKPDMAQGGTKNVGLVDMALQSVYDIVIQ